MLVIHHNPVKETVEKCIRKVLRRLHYVNQIGIAVVWVTVTVTNAFTKIYWISAGDSLI